MILADVLSTPIGLDEALKGGGSLLVLLIGWAIRTWVKSQNLAKALLLVERAAAVGARAAWSTYTDATKKASEDGKLTDEEKKQARDIAFQSAVNALGGAGKTFVQSAMKNGWEKAIREALESEYADFKPSPA